MNSISIPKNMNMNINSVYDLFTMTFPGSLLLTISPSTINGYQAVFISAVTGLVLLWLRVSKQNQERRQDQEKHEKEMKIKDLEIKALEIKLLGKQDKE